MEEGGQPTMSATENLGGASTADALPAVPELTASHDQLDGAFVPGGEPLAAAGALPPKEGKLFVGGISWETVESTIYEHFSAFGELADCVLMTNKWNGTPRGFAFVTYTDPAVVPAVLEQTHRLDGRVVEVKRAVPREESSRERTSFATRLDPRKVFVGGLAASVTEADFRAYFERFGKVSDAIVMVDRETNRSRGFGFVTFVAEDAVFALMNAAPHVLHEKLVDVKPAEPKTADPAALARDASAAATWMLSNRLGAGGRGMPDGSNGHGNGHLSSVPMYASPPPPSMASPQLSTRMRRAWSEDVHRAYGGGGGSPGIFNFGPMAGALPSPGGPGVHFNFASLPYGAVMTLPSFPGGFGGDVPPTSNGGMHSGGAASAATVGVDGGTSRTAAGGSAASGSGSSSNGDYQRGGGGAPQSGASPGGYSGYSGSNGFGGAPRPHVSSYGSTSPLTMVPSGGGGGGGGGGGAVFDPVVAAMMFGQRGPAIGGGGAGAYYGGGGLGGGYESTGRRSVSVDDARVYDGGSGGGGARFFGGVTGGHPQSSPPRFEQLPRPPPPPSQHPLYSGPTGGGGGGGGAAGGGQYAHPHPQQLQPQMYPAPPYFPPMSSGGYGTPHFSGGGGVTGGAPMSAHGGGPYAAPSFAHAYAYAAPQLHGGGPVAPLFIHSPQQQMQQQQRSPGKKDSPRGGQGGSRAGGSAGSGGGGGRMSPSVPAAPAAASAGAAAPLTHRTSSSGDAGGGASRRSAPQAASTAP